MAQHDYVIDNASGLTVRTDINAALQAVVSQNSGPTEPTPTFAGMFWLDTGVTPNVLKQRSADNASWATPAGQLPEAPADGKVYGRTTVTGTAQWVDLATNATIQAAYVKKSGDTMSGSLVVSGGTAFPTAPVAGSFMAALPVSATGQFAYNTYQDAGGWKSLSAGFGGVSAFDKTTGLWTWYTAPTVGSSGAAMAPAARMTLGSSGNLSSVGGGMYSGSGVWAHYPSEANFTMFKSGSTYYYQCTAGNAWQFDSTGGGTFTIQGYNGYRAFFRNSDGAFFISHQAYKPAGGSWQDSSDARIKTITGDYSAGLDQVLTLAPKRFTYKGNDTWQPPANPPPPPDPNNPDPTEPTEPQPPPTVPYPNSGHHSVAVAGTEYIGLIAQEVEAVFPEMVNKVAAYIDGEQVTDLRNLDTTPLIYALINAVKTLAARIEALEGAAS